MNIHVMKGHTFDMSKFPKEDEFERFWHAISPKFSAEASTAAKVAAKVAWKQAICEYATMNKFRIFWDARDREGNQTYTDVEGLDIVDACRRAGIGGGSVSAIDYYKPL